MGFKRNLKKKIGNPSSSQSQASYSRCKEGILKEASELSASGDLDIGLVMISPTDEVTTFAPEGERVEDFFLRFINHPDGFDGSVEEKELLCQKLKKLKVEGEMMEKIGRLMALEKEHFEANEAWRRFLPDVSQIQSIAEADHHEQVIRDALNRIETLKNQRVMEEEASQRSEFSDDEMPAYEVDSDSEIEEAANGKSEEGKKSGEGGNA